MDDSTSSVISNPVSIFITHEREVVAHLASEEKYVYVELYLKAFSYRQWEVIWAKFSSFLSHVVNEHESLDKPLFNKCRHIATIQPRKRLDKGNLHMFVLHVFIEYSLQ